MNRERIIRLLSELSAELADKYGVQSLSLFGSVCRDEAGPDSDGDLLVEFDRPVGYFGLFALQAYLESVLGCKVDLGTPNSLKPRVRDRVLGECVRVAWKLERTDSARRTLAFSCVVWRRCKQRLQCSSACRGFASRAASRN
ncbi:MAG: polymerase beta domain protein region [Acidobacteria bacterium]|nr:polymerase beta domain protein region [Acidobacteriota bacterium]